MNKITILGFFLISIIAFAIGNSLGRSVTKDQIIPDSLTVNTGKMIIDLPYGLDSSHEDLLVHYSGDTLYVYHDPSLRLDIK